MSCTRVAEMVSIVYGTFDSTDDGAILESFTAGNILLTVGTQCTLTQTSFYVCHRNIHCSGIWPAIPGFQEHLTVLFHFMHGKRKWGCLGRSLTTTSTIWCTSTKVLGALKHIWQINLQEMLQPKAKFLIAQLKMRLREQMLVSSPVTNKHWCI